MISASSYCGHCNRISSIKNYFLQHLLVNMAPARTEDEVSWAMDPREPSDRYQGSPRNVKHINAIHWDKSLEPKHYEISGTDLGSKILFLDVNILDSTGSEPYRGDVLIEGERPIMRTADLSFRVVPSKILVHLTPCA